MKFRRILTALLLAVSVTTFAQNPRYIFFFIGDGMGMGHALATDNYYRTVLGHDNHITMMQFPVASQCMTYSASSPVTDSAAAGTALATGNKTKNGMLGMAPDTVAVTSMANVLKGKGWGIGLVTNCAIDDATPGAFYAHVPNRNMYYEIGVQAAYSGYEFLAGAGLRGNIDKKGNPTDLLDVLKGQNVSVVYGRDGYNQAKTDRVMVLNVKEGEMLNQMGYTIDSLENNLDIKILTEQCIDHMKKVSPDKFFMMVEGGQIDHGGHANDGGAIIRETLLFNETLDLAYKFYQEHPEETLIIVTADHDTGGLSVGNAFTGYWANLDYVNYQKVSKDQFSRYCKAILKSRRVYTWDDMKEYLSDNLGLWSHIKVNEDQEKTLQEKFEATFTLRNSEDQKSLYANFNAFAVAVFKVFNDAAGVGFTSPHHTGNLVPVYAVGVGAEKFMGINNNVEIPKKLLEIAGY